MRETALNFAPKGSLVGILTRPAVPDSADARDRPAVLFVNAGILHRVGPNRIHVRLARRLAREGVTSLRLDLPGVGDSRTLGTGLSLAEEGHEAVRAALDLLERQGVADRFVIFGLCSGADSAFRSACLDPRVVGIVIVDPTKLFPTWKTSARRVLRGVVRPISWLRLLGGRYNVVERLRQRVSQGGVGDQPDRASPDLAAGPGGGRGGAASRLTEEAREMASEALAGLVGRGVRICHIITGDQKALYNYRTQLLDAFPAIGLEQVARLELFPEALHTFPRESDRIVLENTVADWIASERFPAPTD